MLNYKLVPIFVPHLGCPYDCVFCNQRQISGTMKDVTIKDVYEILNKAQNDIGEISEVAFYGGSFTAICESLQDELLDVALKFTKSIRISTRPDAINDEILTRIKKKGVKIIELGAQSMCLDVLTKSKRGHTPNDTINASLLIKKYDFELGLQTMIGMPLDNYEKLMYTTEEICKLKPDFVRIYPIVVLANTELFKMYENGEYTPLSVDEAVLLSADVLSIYQKNNIKVIRVGLNPTEDLSSDTKILGAYHPAFGQLVASEIYYKKIKEIIGSLRDCDITFGVNKSEISTAVGQKRVNTMKIYKEFNIKAKFVAVDIEKGKVKLC